MRASMLRSPVPNKAKSQFTTVAVVSHQDAIKAAIAHYAGIPLDLFHRIEISPASVSVIRLAEWGPQIVTINHTGEVAPR